MTAVFYFVADDGRDPLIYQPEAYMTKYLNKIVAVLKWAQSPDGRKDIGAAVAAVTAIYVALHRLGVL